MAAVSNTSTLGEVLEGLCQRAERVIVKDKDAGITVSHIGGNDVRRTIEQAQAQYTTSLTTTMHKVDTKISQWMAELEALLVQAEQGGQKLAGRAQALTNTLPLSKHYIPQLCDASPSSVFRPHQPNPVDVDFTFSGNFTELNTIPNPPTLTFNNQEHSITANNGMTLCCRIPFSTLFPTNATHRMIYTEGTLSVPWMEPNTPNTAYTAHFKVLIGAFPAFPGEITLHHITERSMREHRCYFPWYSFPSYGGGIITGLDKYQFTSWGTVYFPGAAQTSITLTWNYNRHIPAHLIENPHLFTHAWKIEFNPFDHPSQKIFFDAKDYDRSKSPYLQVMPQGESITISATLPNTVQS